jgi:hypothetical protein
MSETISTTPFRWFVRGLLVGVLVSGSLNAGSYFLRSQGMGNLLGLAPHRRESLGFPVEVWEAGNAYGGLFVDPRGLLINGLFTLVLGIICGILTVRYRGRLDQIVDDFERRAAERTRGRVQLSIGGLLLATGIAAVAAAAARYAIAGRAEVLGVIYVLGPWMLILIAFVPLGISWQMRIGILIPTAGLLMAAAVALGWHLNPRIDFDKVLLGIYICWTPQTVVAAIGLMAMLVLGPSARETQETAV